MKKIIFFLFAVLIIPLVAAHDTPVGFDIYNDTFEIWNTEATYYFNASTGIQWTNHFDEYWSKNIFCLGYYDGDTWNKIKCADELSNFNKDAKTDNLTYVNATLWKDFTYGGYDMRLGIRYHLLTEDEDLSVIIFAKNRDTEDIPYELGFAWKVTDIQISMDEEDKVGINASVYNLNESVDILFKNLTIYHDEFGYIKKTYFKIEDPNTYEFLRLGWKDNLNPFVKLYSDGDQSNSYITIYVNGGLFSADQQKQTTFLWRDPEGDFIASWVAEDGNDDPTSIDYNDTDIFVGDDSDSKVYVYDHSGNYRYNLDLNASITYVMLGFTTNGSWFWAGNQEDTGMGVVNIYNESFDSIGNWSYNSSISNLNGLATNDTWIWVQDFSGDAIYKYNKTGTQFDKWTTTAAGASQPLGVAYYGDYIYTTDYSDDLIYKFQVDGTFIETISQHVDNTNSWGITTNGYYIWTSDDDPPDIIFQYRGGRPTEFPQFSDYWDDNGSLLDTGTGEFNVTVTSTNGTVYLIFDGQKIIAKNMTDNGVYNATKTFSVGGYYNYYWTSYGNGTDANINNSINRTYTVNQTAQDYNRWIQAWVNRITTNVIGWLDNRGNMWLAGALNVTGNSTYYSDLIIRGNIYAEGTTRIEGEVSMVENVTFEKDLIIEGQIFGASPVKFGDGITVNGTINVTTGTGNVWTDNITLRDENICNRTGTCYTLSDLNTTGGESTYNATYDTWAYNQSFFDTNNTYNATYDAYKTSLNFTEEINEINGTIQNSNASWLFDSNWSRTVLEAWFNYTYPNWTRTELDKFNVSYYSDEEWIIRNSSFGFNFNESMLEITYYNVTTAINDSGIILSGAVANISHSDGNYDGITLNISEVAGSPGLDVKMNFTNIPDFTSGVMRYKTTNILGEYPIIQLWEWNDEVWEDYPQVSETENFAFIEQSIFDADDHISGDGTVAMRIYKSSNGNINNEYYIDWVAIAKGFGVPAGEETDPLSVHRDGGRSLTGNWDQGSFNLTSITSWWFGKINSTEICFFDICLTSWDSLNSTYNSTYDTWAYNMTILDTNNTYNATYDTWAYNQSFFDTNNTYNATYHSYGTINSSANIQTLLNGTALTLHTLNMTGNITIAENNTFCLNVLCSRWMLSNSSGVYIQG